MELEKFSDVFICVEVRFPAFLVLRRTTNKICYFSSVWPCTMNDTYHKGFLTTEDFSAIYNLYFLH